MLPTKEINRITQERFAAYESGDASRVATLYAENAEYWDTKTGGRLRGKGEVHRHVHHFLEAFDVRYAVLEEHRLEGRNAAIVLWECAVRRRQPGGTLGRDLLMQRGMNLLEIEDGLIAREESYMDRAALDRLPVTHD
jgi:ketosteroid isomerase-like protein